MSVQEKLQKGRDLLNKAGNDSDLLGLAITSIHGALEDACRNWLAAPQIKQQHGIDVQNKNGASWQNLLELMPRYCRWSEKDVGYVRKINSLRNKAAHGDGFEGTRQDVEKYLRYVENVVAKGGSFSNASSATSNSSTNQYFPNNIYQGGTVTPFRFCIERSDRGVKISNRKGRKGASIISARANGWSFSSSILSIEKIGLYMIIICLILLFIGNGSFGFGLLTLVFLWEIFQHTPCSVFITLDRIYIGKKSDPLIEGTYFKSVQQKTGNLYKVHVIQPNGVVYFAHNLTWHEADELIRIAIKSIHMIQDSRSQFSVEFKDGLIFIKSLKTSMSFVVEHNDKLEQSLRCRMVENNLVVLTKSELEELYSKKLQEFRV